MDLSKPHCFVKTNIMLLVIRRMAHIKQKKMIDRREKNGEKARQIQAPPPRPAPHTLESCPEGASEVCPVHRVF